MSVSWKRFTIVLGVLVAVYLVVTLAFVYGGSGSGGGTSYETPGITTP